MKRQMLTIVLMVSLMLLSSCNTIKFSKPLLSAFQRDNCSSTSSHHMWSPNIVCMSIRCRACVRVDMAVGSHLVHPQYGAHGDGHNSIESSASVSYQISVVTWSVTALESREE